LSKVFGVYYHRIGGVFLKEANPLLYGNMWFKNVFSMRYGEALMKQFDVNYFPKKYKDLKLKTIQQLESTLKLKMRSSDALLLTTIEKEIFEHEKFLIRSKDSKSIRVCITPLLETLIKKDINHE
jgi:hypothetical protein